MNSLNERFQMNSLSDYSTVQGSLMLHAGGGTLANLTSWRLVLPLEFKMHILTMSKLEHDRKQASAGQ